MPDRYGERFEPTTPDITRMRDTRAAIYRAIDTCTLCDQDGDKPDGLPCDHIDHQAARIRGMAMIRPVLDQIAQRRKDRRP